MFRSCLLTLILTFIGLQLIAGELQAQVSLVATVRIPGTVSDKSGLVGTLETGTPQNALGGFSAIDYSGQKDRYFVLSDRGAGDGAASFQCRFHEIEFSIGNQPSEARFELVNTRLLRNRDGRSLVGSLEPMKKWDGGGHAPSLDPEGIRRSAENHFVVSDEYGPSVDWFDEDGLLKKSMPIPDHFRLSEKLSPPMTRGTYTNRGIEGISLSPDNRWLVAAMQGPLVQDGRIENNKCLGLATRWLVYDLQNGGTKEWLYLLDDESTGLSEVLAIDDQRFLTLERDSKAGSKAKIKHIYLVDASQATDVSSVSSFRNGIPEGHRAMSKRLLIDLMLPEYGLSGDATPEKPEGLAWGPSTKNGQRLLVVCFDNDFEPEQDSLLQAFLIDERQLNR
jgi:hypothetical protein